MTESAPARHIVCPHCQGINRIPTARDARKANCGRCHQPLFTAHPVAADAKAFATHIGRNDVPVVVDFWAAWCGPCRAMAPVFERAAAEFEPHIRFLKVDTEAEPQLAAQYQIRGIPLLMMFRNGRVVAQQAGLMDDARPRAWLRQHAGSASAA